MGLTPPDGGSGVTQHDVNPANYAYAYPSGAAPAPAPPAPTYVGHGSAAPARGGGATYTPPGSFTAGAPASVKPVNLMDTPYAWMLSIPDVAQTLNQWQAGGYDDNWLKAHIEQTNWWKTTSSASRNWEQLWAQDPASANEQMVAKAGDLMAKAAELGLNLPWDYALKMANDAIRLNWTQNQAMDALGHIAWKQGGGLSGEGILQQTQNQLRQMANQYLVPISDQALVYWSDAAVFLNQGTKGFESYLQEQAKSLFPSLAPAIDQGITVQQYVDPYRQLAAKTLEVNPNSINFEDPKWQKALTQVDPKTGQRVSMSLSDWQTEMMSNPIYGYDKTTGARTQAADLAGKLLSTFGAGQAVG